MKEDFEKQLRDYLKKENLIQKDHVQINAKLNDDFDFDDNDSAEESEPIVLQKIEEKEEDESTANLKEKTKKGFKSIKFSKLLEKMELQTTKVFKVRNIKTGEESIKQGTFDGVLIYAEKAHGKPVTRISNLEFLGFNSENMFELFQEKFSASGAIHDTVVSKEKVKEITLNGSFGELLKDYLLTEVNIPEKYVNLVDKLSDKKNKKGPMGRN